MKYCFSFLLSLVLLSSGCSKSLTGDELDIYLANPSNGLTQKQEVNGLSVEVTYRPSALVALDESQTGKSLPQQYYLLSISRHEAEVLDPSRDFSAYSSLLQTLAFRPHEYIQLTSVRGDTLYPSNSILERTYGMGSSTRLLIAFTAKDNKQDITLHLKEFGLHTGNLLFAFKQQDVAAIPALKREPTTNSIP